MAFDSNIKYHVFKDYNINFDEKGNSFGAVRLVQWVKEGNEPDETKAKIEIRKFRATADGEQMGKGYSFSTPEGVDELAEGLVSIGFGNTKELLKSIRLREDFMEAATHINDEESDGEGEMFDMRSLLMGIDSEEEEDDSDE